MSENQAQYETTLRRRWTAIILSTLILFHAVSHIVWLALDERQLNWDPGWHLKNSLAAWEVMTSPSTNMLQRLSKVTHTVEPPLVYVLTMVPYALFGFSADTATYINIFFLCMLILATYGIGKELYDQATGLVAACLVSCYPLVAGYARIYYLDIGLATVVAVSMLTLIRTKCFTSRRASIVFGFTLAAGLLTKKAFVIFMFAPMLLVIAQILFAHQSGSDSKGVRVLRWQRLLNLVLAMVIGALLSAGWYVSKLQSILSQAERVRQAGTGIGYGWSRWVYYPSRLDDVLCTSAILLLITGVAIGLFRRDKRLSIPLTWLASGLILLSLIQLGHSRYLLPLVPSIALLSAWWLFSLRPTPLRKALIATVILISLSNYFVFSWYGPVGQGPRADDSRDIFVRPFPRNRQVSFLVGPKAFKFAYPPRRIGWPFEEILDTVRNDTQEGGKRAPSLFFGANFSGFNIVYAQYYAYLQKVKHSYRNRIIVPYSLKWQENYILRLFDQQYILEWSGNITARTRFRTYVENFLEAFSTIRETVPDRFHVIRVFDLPDGSKASLYCRTGPKLSELQAAFDSDVPTQEEVVAQLELYRKLSIMVGPKHPDIIKKYIELAQLLVKHGQTERAIRTYATATQSCTHCPGLSSGIEIACRDLVQPGGFPEQESADSRTTSLHAICRDAQDIVEDSPEEIR